MISKRQCSGFTLIEVMIVVAIIGILAAVAYPSYREYILKGKRAEVRAVMAEFMQQQERYLTQRNEYLGIKKTDGESAKIKNFSGKSWAAADFKIHTDFCTGETTYRNCVKAVATPTADPAINELYWSSTGAKTCDADRPEVCWK